VTESLEETLSKKREKRNASYTKAIFIIIKNQEMSNLTRMAQKNCAVFVYSL
jgi:hypothetical protein